MRIIFVIFLVLIALAVAGGSLYIMRPWPKLETEPMPTPALVDNTIPIPAPMSEDEKKAQIQPIAGLVQVTLKTNKGDIEMVLDGPSAPIAVGNFVKLALDDFYDGTIFHRVIPGFMIQGGDPTGTGTGGPGYKFADEQTSRPITRGSVAMANAGPNTNGSQFFIVTAEATPHLDGVHTNFGVVQEGMEVVDAIAAVDRDARDKPLEDVVIEDVVVHNVEKKEPEPPALKFE